MQRTQCSFYKERLKNVRKLRSFEKKAKERKNVTVFWKERLPNPSKQGPYCIVTDSQAMDENCELNWPHPLSLDIY